MKYTIEVTEIQKNTFEIEAESKEEALEAFQSDYFQHANDYFLEVDDTAFEVIGIEG